MDSVTLAFPEYRPDVFDRNAKLTRFMQNAVPRGDGSFAVLASEQEAHAAAAALASGERSDNEFQWEYAA